MPATGAALARKPIPRGETTTEATFRRGMGWLPDVPDFRDFNVNTETVRPAHAALSAKEPIKSMLKRMNIGAPAAKLPTRVDDLEKYFSAVEDQGELNSCTANAGVGIVEYFENRAFGRHIEASRLFLYKVTRNIIHETADQGAYLRNTMGAMALFGLPPEEYWPYEVADVNEEPPAFCYAFAQNYQAIKYYRLDPAGTTTKELLQRIKTNLAAGLPSMFGFAVYSSFRQAISTGEIPLPADGESLKGGHAMVVVGYDDHKGIQNTNPGGPKTTGALRIRNSWGSGWGDNGYGWLPYDYVLLEGAEDFWSVLKSEWVDTGNFKI